MNSDPFNRNVTLADVAHLAGVNKSTVSRALRDCSHVGKATRDRVLKAAAELEYRPDPTIARLAAQRWRKEGRVELETLTVLLGERSPRALRIIDTTREISMNYGYEMDAVFFDDFVSNASLVRMLEYRGAKKILVFGFKEGDLLDSNLLERFAVINCGSILEQPVCSIDLDWRRMLDIAVEHLEGYGRKRIGLSVLGAEEREQGILDSRFGELFAGRGGGIPVLGSSRIGSRNGVGDILSWYCEYKLDGIVCLSSQPSELLSDLKVQDVPVVYLETSGEDCSGMTAGFCCGEQLVVERAIQLLQLSKTLSSKSRMELHHIVPDWRVPAELEKSLCLSGA
ncbi:LacI family DNA-binding transcriptional regulator [Pelagicoccus sp. SDUM812002]|uniref:LacI family DNA-binding transcriptional regulator n=1 Tax=Pelagicoccus sp. SDUM812002 TaxID=3041266 RepID=UPI00280FB511|nr:LacI family DNA-binding transcriptional regulator [Pelagicoccus sp. SDUM812002]MDQ8188217.1 LacI family DNA-binding transcriptional regulator [Pelagicoccus sp. SDUM812002]